MSVSASFFIFFFISINSSPYYYLLLSGSSFALPFSLVYLSLLLNDNNVIKYMYVCVKVGMGKLINKDEYWKMQLVCFRIPNVIHLGLELWL